ncbi:MAG: carboxypeptidase-like regulatory domain-containing protein [Candidatus Polarisedimenticolia bacterium]
MKRVVAGLLVAALLAVLSPSPALSAGAGTIKGTLLDSNGQPMVGYTVKVVDSTGAVYESPPTGPDGKYEIPNLAEGSYTYQIVDPTGKIVPVQIPAVNLQAGTVVTQPIAIVPKSAGGKGALTAWLVGGGAAVLAAIAIASGNNDDDNDDDPPMTASTP